MPTSHIASLFLRVIPPVLLLIVAIGSLFLPYVLRTNFDYQHESLPHFVNGYHLINPYFSLLFFVPSCVLLIFWEGRVTTTLAFVTSVISAAFIPVIRRGIHIQLWGHDFDTSCGIGFYVLCACMAALCTLALVRMILALIRPEKVVSQPADLLDDMP